MPNKHEPHDIPIGSGSKELGRLERLKLGTSNQAWLDYLDRKLQGINTGIDKLDELLLGLPDLTVIQGCPGVNKSTLALQIAHYHLAQGGVMYYIDRENKDVEIQTRLICQSNRCTSNTLKEATDEDRLRYAKKVGGYLSFYSSFDVAPDKLLKEFEADMAHMIALAEGKPVIVIVDSVQALPLFERGNTLLESTQAWMRLFDQYKLRYPGKVTFILVSEKKRSSYQEADLAGGKESGAIEYKGELVMDLRPGTGQDIILEIVKNRHGISKCSVVLERYMVDLNNPQSFCFLLRAKEVSFE